MVIHDCGCEQIITAGIITTVSGRDFRCSSFSVNC